MFERQRQQGQLQVAQAAGLARQCGQFGRAHLPQPGVYPTWLCLGCNDGAAVQAEGGLKEQRQCRAGERGGQVQQQAPTQAKEFVHHGAVPDHGARTLVTCSIERGLGASQCQGG